MAVSKIMRPVVVAYGEDRDGNLVFMVSDPARPQKLHTVLERGGIYACQCEKQRCDHIETVRERMRRAQTRQIGALSTTREYDDRMSLNAEKAPYWFWRVA